MEPWDEANSRAGAGGGGWAGDSSLNSFVPQLNCMSGPWNEHFYGHFQVMWSALVIFIRHSLNLVISFQNMLISLTWFCDTHFGGSAGFMGRMGPSLRKASLPSAGVPSCLGRRRNWEGQTGEAEAVPRSAAPVLPRSVLSVATGTGQTPGCKTESRTRKRLQTDLERREVGTP